MNKNKIDNIITQFDNDIVEMSKPVYSSDNELNCGVINYNDKKYKFDFIDRDSIINFNKRFVFNEADDVYPSYNYNRNRVNYLQFIFGFKDKNVNYVFKNNNIYDLRKSNVICYHHYHEEVCAKYNVIEYIPGHYSMNGVDPYFMKNPLWKIQENENIYLLMYCEKNTLCKLSLDSYKKILDFEKNNDNDNKITWHKHSNGYILSSHKSLFIHQIIMNCYGNGRGTKNVSVDHIDRNPLNNTMENLRIATRKEQEQNSKGISVGTKRARKSNAKPLPEGITQDMMGKYVNYYHEYLDKEKTKSREFFKIETHPKLVKIWIGTKSNKVPILEKLTTVNKVVEDLKKDIYPINNENELPTHITIKVERNKPHIIFDKKTDDGKRLNLRMVLPDEYVLSEQLHIFKEKIKTKYDITIE